MRIQDTCVDHFRFLLISVCFKNGVDTAWFMLFALMEFFCVYLMWSIFFFEFNFQFFKFQFYLFFSILSCYIACLVRYLSTTYIIGIPLAAAEPAELWTRCEWEYVIYVSVHLCDLVMSIFLFLFLFNC